MAKRIELSFRTDPAASLTSHDRDTGVLKPEPDAHEEALKKNIAKLDSLKIGKRTAAEVVRGLGLVLGQELYPAEIIQQDGETAKVFLEHRESDLIYDVTDGGEVDTSMARIFGIEHRLHDHLFVKFQTKFTNPPSVMLGLNYLDEARGANVRITGYAKQIHSHLFDLYSEGRYDTVVYGAGYTWLAVPSYAHPLLQVGTFDTLEDHPWGEKKPLTHRAVTFPCRYKSPPKVIVWLRGIDSYCEFNDRVMAFATDVTSTGFTLHVNTWGDSWLHGAETSWFAYPADTSGICSGTLQLGHTEAGVVTFDPPFTKTPRRILVALNKLEMDIAFNCRFKIIHEAVSERGMGIRVETWGDSKIYQSGVSYIAME